MSLARWTAIRDQISTTLKSVSVVSIVQPFPRLAPDKQTSKWLSWMRDRSRINAWTIFRESTKSVFGTCHQYYRDTNVLLIGMLQHNDENATADEFDELVDLVLEAFHKNIHLNLPGTVDIQGPADLLLEELRLVNNIAVHYAEIGFKVRQTLHIKDM